MKNALSTEWNEESRKAGRILPRRFNLAFMLSWIPDRILSVPHPCFTRGWKCLTALLLAAQAAQGAGLDLPLNTWVKLSPLTNTPPSPRLGYEGACVWDAKHQVMIRYGGHNQGGGGEQHSEMWTFDPRTAKWTLKEPNVQPPGICCGQQNVFDPQRGRYLRDRKSVV